MSPEQIDWCRGAAWERKWRGRLSDYPDAEELRTAVSRWTAVLQPSRVVIGEWPIRRVGLGTYQWRYDQAVIEAALLREVPILDTAETYGYGKVEKQLGEVLSRVPHPKTWIATKVSRSHLSFQSVQNAAKRSQDALQVEQIDLYQVHWPRPELFGATAEGLAHLLGAKTIARVGVCNFCSHHLSTFLPICRANGFEVVSNQIRLNQTDSGAIDWLIPYSQQIGVKIIAYSPLAQGKVSSHTLPWVLQHADYIIPATNSLVHLEENLQGEQNAK